MAYASQQTPNTNYFCCGNPWDDIFGSTDNQVDSPQTQQAQAPKPQTQDWNDPFNTTYAPYNERDETRMSDESVDRSVTGDARSMGSRSADTMSTATRRKTYVPKTSNLEGKSLADIEREDHARSRALRMQEGWAASGDFAEEEGASVLTSGYMARKHKLKQTFDQPEVATKTAAVNAAVKELKELRKHQASMKKTETTREKKELTPEDVRDPETVPGMKCRSDVEMEEEAKIKAFQMISNGQYQYDQRAGMAMWSTTTKSNVTRKTSIKGKVQEIV
jgi:hypothetical protein